VAALAAAPSAGAAPGRVIFTLAAPTAFLSRQPPLVGAVIGGEREPQLFRQTVESREHVTVAVDRGGRPAAVSVVQRLRIAGKGDYVYTIPAPVLGVEATADSESAPGRRSGAILWAGFSPRTRLLGARARLAVRAAAPYLPLRVSIRATAHGVALTLRNATQLQTHVAHAPASAADVARALEGARHGIFPAAGVPVAVTPPPQAAAAAVEAPLAVSGEVSFGATTRRFSVLLGDGRPLTQVVQLSGAGAARVRLHVMAVAPRSTVVPPGGATHWTAANAAGRFVLAQLVYLRAARAHQYQAFIANPGPLGSASSADYTYVSAAPARPAPAAGHGGGLGTLGLVLVLLGCVLAACAAVVAWAHL
jgi:hypothetical protein